VGGPSPSDKTVQKTFTYPKFDFVTPPELAEGKSGHYPVVVVGAGPVGLAAAIDLAQHGSPCCCWTTTTRSASARAACAMPSARWSAGPHGLGRARRAKGVTWNVGRTFYARRRGLQLQPAPETGHDRPGMVNLQQYYLEEYLVAGAPAAPDRPALEEPGDRSRRKATTVGAAGGDARGRLHLQADWLVVADGARSPIRTHAGPGHRRQGLPGPLPDRRRGDEGRLSGRALVLVRPALPPQPKRAAAPQADNVWRIDFQLGWDADPEAEKQPERVIPRIRAMLGRHEREFELEWVSVYTFQCRRMQPLPHGRVLFAGDAAHQVSPFGARGANSGMQDTDNLAWKLKLVLDGLAPAALLDTYSEERVARPTRTC
jgi:3-(3-hydroxy-phenyl)propionate hydroxylase